MASDYPKCPHYPTKPRLCRKCKWGETFPEGGGICILDYDSEDDIIDNEVFIADQDE